MGLAWGKAAAIGGLKTPGGQDLLGHGEGLPGAAEGLHLGARPVGGELQEGRQIRELAAPVVELGRQRLAVEPLALGRGVVGILHGERRQG